MCHAALLEDLHCSNDMMYITALSIDKIASNGEQGSSWLEYVLLRSPDVC